MLRSVVGGVGGFLHGFFSVVQPVLGSFSLSHVRRGDPWKEVDMQKDVQWKSEDSNRGSQLG